MIVVLFVRRYKFYNYYIYLLFIFIYKFLLKYIILNDGYFKNDMYYNTNYIIDRDMNSVMFINQPIVGMKQKENMHIFFHLIRT